MTNYQLIVVLVLVLSFLIGFVYVILYTFKLHTVLKKMRYKTKRNIFTRRKIKRLISNCSNTEQCLSLKLALKYRDLSYVFFLISIISFIILSFVSP